MRYADSITKKFLSYAQPRIIPSSDGFILEWQDPTFLGFQWRIINTQDYTKGSGQLDLDYFPQGLFLPDDDPDSAVSYFVRTNQTARAQMIREFKSGFLQVLKEAPWYFTKVTGLSEIWKTNPANPYRGKDKKITIETEESVDLKMTYLMDLYRKAVFDSSWMRYALPENQRMFAMELVVAEVRPLQTSLSNWIDLNTGVSNPGVVLSDVGGLFRTVGNLADQLAGSGIGGELATRALAAAAGAAGGAVNLRAPWSTTTFISFRFDMCTFDTFTTAPNYLESVGKTADAKAMNTIVINTPYIYESNSYGILGAVLKDSFYASDYTYSINDVNQVPRTINDTLGGKSYASTVEIALRQLAGNLASALGIENVYGFSAASALQGLSGLASNPLATVQGLVQQFAAQGGVTQADLGNIGLTGEEVKLIAEFLGNAIDQNIPGGLVVGNIGSTVEDSQNTNPNLVKGSIGRTVEDDVIGNPDLVAGNLPKNILTGPSIVRARLGNVYKQ